MKILMKLCCVTLTLSILLCGCAGKPDVPVEPDLPEPPPAETPEPQQVQPTEPEPQPEPLPEPEPEPIAIRITAAGDNLLHNTVSFDCALENGGYDFSHLYENVAEIFQSSDIAFINQEVMLTGEAGAYPRLAAPLEVADALIGAGFNVINLATNHTLDKGMAGLETCLETVHGQPFDAILGAFQTEEASSQLCILEKQGIRIGFLSYTYGLNGFQLPADQPWRISLIDEGKMKADLEAIRPLCDYLIVSMHWGNEYQTVEGDYQNKLARLLCDGGADLIIGTHPHVLQPMEWLEREDGHRTLCAYSLGNFISNQHKRATMLGGVLQVDLLFHEDGTLQ